MVFGKNIARIRESRGLTQVEAADRVDIPQSTFSQIENGITTNPRIKTLMDIARALGVSIHTLLADDRPTLIEELPISPQAKECLAEPDFAPYLDLAILLYAHNVDAEAIKNLLYAFIPPSKRVE